jgi:Tol biopolymer transport system component/DNA-binding winged helix-turn-helix (wHTH) protein
MLYRFRDFEADSITGRLFRDGKKNNLQELPFRVLLALLERPGELVTREELQKKVWPADTFVNFEQGLNVAIKKLRDALGDSAEQPQFIETFARRGYQFIVPVEVLNGARMVSANGAAAPDIRPSTAGVGAGIFRKRIWLAASVVILLGLGTVGGTMLWEARARLGGDGTERPTTALALVLPNPANDASEGRISGDGRYLSFVDWETYDLWIHDFSMGTDRNLTNQKAGEKHTEYAEESAISRDGQRIAFTWGNAEASPSRTELRLGNLAGEFAPRTLYRNPEAHWISVFDWSPDDKLLAVEVERRDRTYQIGLLSVSDGSLRVLKSIDEWQGAGRMFFSPDGKYLGYDVPHDNRGLQRDVFVISVDGATENHAVANPVNDIDIMMGWSPDGKWLLFASERTEPASLWGMPFADGKTNGSPRLLQPDLPARLYTQLDAAGVTRSGALYYSVESNSTLRSKVLTVSFDFSAGRFVSAPVEIPRGYHEGNGAQAWLPDGAHLSYKVNRGSGLGFGLVIRSMDTGEVREIQPKMNSFDDGKWSPDGRWFLTRGQDLKGRWGIFQIDGQTGDALPLVMDDAGEMNMFPIWAPDGKSFYFPREYPATHDRAAIQRDLISGRERVLIRGRYVRGGSGVSPDGRFTIASDIDSATNSRTLLLISLPDLQRRELMRMPSNAPPDQLPFFSQASWAPDSQSFLVWRKREDPTGSELWQVFLDGRQPRRIEAPAVAIASNLPFAVSPDGKRLAFRYTEKAQTQNGRVFELSHFLPERAEK